MLFVWLSHHGNAFSPGMSCQLSEYYTRLAKSFFHSFLGRMESCVLLCPPLSRQKHLVRWLKLLWLYSLPNLPVKHPKNKFDFLPVSQFYQKTIIAREN